MSSDFQDPWPKIGGNVEKKIYDHQASGGSDLDKPNDSGLKLGKVFGCAVSILLLVLIILVVGPYALMVLVFSAFK